MNNTNPVSITINNSVVTINNNNSDSFNGRTVTTQPTKVSRISESGSNLNSSEIEIAINARMEDIKKRQKEFDALMKKAEQMEKDAQQMEKTAKNQAVSAHRTLKNDYDNLSKKNRLAQSTIAKNKVDCLDSNTQENIDNAKDLENKILKLTTLFSKTSKNANSAQILKLNELLSKQLAQYAEAVSNNTTFANSSIQNKTDEEKINDELKSFNNSQLEENEAEERKLHQFVNSQKKVLTEQEELDALANDLSLSDQEPEENLNGTFATSALIINTDEEKLEIAADSDDLAKAVVEVPKTPEATGSYFGNFGNIFNTDPILMFCSYLVTSAIGQGQAEDKK